MLTREYCSDGLYSLEKVGSAPTGRFSQMEENMTTAQLINRLTSMIDGAKLPDTPDKHGFDSSRARAYLITRIKCLREDIQSQGIQRDK